MALLSTGQELARARPGIAFANGTEFECWSAIWCDECAREPTCPLLEIAICEQVTPAAWEDARPGYLNRYHCHEFQSKSTTSKESDK